jgi:hypothetical protein
MPKVEDPQKAPYHAHEIYQKMLLARSMGYALPVTTRCCHCIRIGGIVGPKSPSRSTSPSRRLFGKVERLVQGDKAI